jgi:SAM-dependent methyltransferase
VPKNVRVLDIGSGFGESLGYHKARGCDVYGVEADENLRRVADKFGYKVHIGLFDPNKYDTDFFDYVTMDQVIEHVSNPVKILRGIQKVMKPGGVLILGTPNSDSWGAKLLGRRWISWHTPYHLQLFSKQSMKLAAEEAGLIMDGVKTITDSEWLRLQWIHLFTRPNIGEPSVFWASDIKQNLYQKSLIAILTGIHLTKVNHVITRFFDALGIGDNYIFFLRKK